MTTILLVDDDRTVVDCNAAELRAAGYLVEAVAGAAAALDRIRQGPPDLVVLEGLLDGGLRGFELARTLARDLPELPLIMLTRADDVLSAAERARQDRDGGWVPVVRYLEKPVMPEVLAYEVGHVLRERATAAAATR
jgi:CheY-like chemotaxis protein